MSRKGGNMTHNYLIDQLPSGLWAVRERKTHFLFGLYETKQEATQAAEAAW
jgi:hypothetical protein